MAVIEFDAPGYHGEITSTTAISPASKEFRALADSLEIITNAFAPVSLNVTASGSDYTYALVGAAGRTYSATLRPTGHLRKITGTSFWTLGELLIHNPVIENVFAMLDKTMTKLEVDWS